MSDLRTAALRALEALEYYRSGEDYQPTPASEAITAIKDALGQPQEPEPLDQLKRLREMLREEVDRLIAAKAEPVQTLTDDERAAIEFFQLNPRAALLAFSRRLGRSEPEQPVQDTDYHAQGICQRSGYSIAQRKPLTETSAERTLKRLGYTDCGGEFWKPPLGAPDQPSLLPDAETAWRLWGEVQP